MAKTISIDELMKLNPQSLSNDQLKEAASRLAYASNKRIKRMEEADVWSPALTKAISASGGERFSVSGQNRAELIHTFASARNFLSAESGNLRGARSFQRKTSEAIQKASESDIELSGSETKRIWEIFGELEKSHPEIANRMYKYDITNEISTLIGDRRRTNRSIIQNLEDRLGEIYETATEALDDFTSFD